MHSILTPVSSASREGAADPAKGEKGAAAVREADRGTVEEAGGAASA